MIYQQTVYPEQTAVFLKWWSKNKEALWTEGHAGPLPARRSSSADPYFQENAVRNFIFGNYLLVAKTTVINAPGMFPHLNTIEGDGVMQALIQEILQGKDLAPAMVRAEDKLKANMK